jgi:hypothetical protein
LKSICKIIAIYFVLLFPAKQFAQHHCKMVVAYNKANKTLDIKQEITFFNESADTLTSIFFNDWNNAYSDKDTPLARRFSDEFYRGFHLANQEERGSTINLIINDSLNSFLPFERTKKNPDWIEVQLKKKLAPNQKTTFYLSYITKIPSDKFTKYGYNSQGDLNLKNWFLTPSRYENHQFILYNNNNLDDITNGICNFEIEFKIPTNTFLFTDLESLISRKDNDYTTYSLSGRNRTDFNVVIENQISFSSFKNKNTEILTNLKGRSLDEIKKAIVIDRIINFVNSFIGEYPHTKLLITQTDYEKNPFYGLNQLPRFINPFEDEFLFEIKFLKTYLNDFLKNSLRLDPRKDNWIYDGIQVYAMIKYIEDYYPNNKMMGNAASFRLLKSFHLTQLDFNEQYNYFYLLMARKNLDQPIGNSKNTLIKFNEQIAGKYRAGLSLNYLDNYLGNNIVSKSIQEFYKENQLKQVSRNDLELLLRKNTNQDICWFFETIINTRAIVDYKFSEVIKTKDSITFTMRNRTNVLVPIPVYGLKNGTIVSKTWIEPLKTDSIYRLERKNIDKIVINYKNEVPEYNLRNNWKKLEGFFPNNRPLKFTFMKDLEDPYYNQILYAPILTYNVYDGLSPGMRFHNKTILNKPFIFDINPTYSLKSQNLSGSTFFAINKDYRNSKLFNVRYSISANYYHYAPDATYLKLNPMIQLSIREDNYRDNRKQFLLFRQVIVNREKSAIVIDNSTQNYSVFDAKYINSKTELTHHFSFISEMQISAEFGKIIAQTQFRKLFEDNRELNLRLYAGIFLFNKSNSDFFSFALDRPTDYLFDYNYYGRSESTGLFSRQFILAEGGFKSKLDIPYANQWITTFNGSYSIWNWVEFYNDLGLVKNKSNKTKFVYDTGLRLNLLTDYFELYFPIYSNNGWEVAQKKYNEKIRFIITLDPGKLTSLFTRKWF